MTSYREKDYMLPDQRPSPNIPCWPYTESKIQSLNLRLASHADLI